MALLSAACGSPSGPTVITPPTDPPTIACPTVAPSASTDGMPVPVAYPEPIVAGGQQPFTLTCSPVSGAIYPVGTTDVTCTVRDAQSRTASCTFPVAVAVPKPPKISLTKFLAFGDSLTYGEDGRASSAFWAPGLQNHPTFQVPLGQTYPDVLQALLTARYTTQSFTVDNAGQKGEQVVGSGALSRLGSILRTGRYEAVLILEGANDLAERDDRIVPSVISGLRQMVNDAKSRGVRPFLATLPPQHHGCCPDRGLSYTLVPTLNEQIRILAQQEGVTLVELYDAMLPNESTYIGFDGLHPSAEGYAKIANTFFDALKKELEIPETSNQRPEWFQPRRR
jgi:lysophospholipase L1-like esterase